MKPTLKTLRVFAKRYFKKPIPIRYKKFKSSLCGMAYFPKRAIALNYNIPLDNSRFYVGCGISFDYKKYYRELKLKEGDQYFLTLLHEIAHFKFKLKPSKTWIKLKTKLSEEVEEALREKMIFIYVCGLKRLTKAEKSDYVESWLDCNAKLKRKKDESDLMYLIRNDKFRGWVMGHGIIEEHERVELWAIREFKKRRKEIKQLLFERKN